MLSSKLDYSSIKNSMHNNKKKKRWYYRVRSPGRRATVRILIFLVRRSGNKTQIEWLSVKIEKYTFNQIPILLVIWWYGLVVVVWPSFSVAHSKHSTTAYQPHGTSTSKNDFFFWRISIVWYVVDRGRTANTPTIHSRHTAHSKHAVHIKYKKKAKYSIEMSHSKRHLGNSMKLDIPCFATATDEHTC